LYTRAIAASCLSAEGWPCAGYSGPEISVSSVLVISSVSIIWSKPHTRKCSQSLGRMLGRPAVINAVYECIKRIGSSQSGDSYIHRRRKIKDKSAQVRQKPINKTIVAQMQRPQFEKLRRNHFRSVAPARRPIPYACQSPDI
jgi:hypothetical protein